MFKTLSSFFFWTLLFYILIGFKRLSAEDAGIDLQDKHQKTNILFYIQRSINISIINYELNLNEKEELNIKEPIKIYWKNLAVDSSVQALNYIQKKYAYGIDLKIVDPEKKSFSFNFVSYKKKMIYLARSPMNGKYHAFCEIAGKLVVLTKIFIQIEGGTFWLPNIKYVEITGKDLSKDKTVTERIIL